MFRLFSALSVIPLILAALTDESGRGWYRHDYTNFDFKITMGTPVQGPFSFKFSPLMTNSDIMRLRVSNKHYLDGAFNPNASESFRYVGPIAHQPRSFSGTEKLSGGPTIWHADVDVMDFHVPEGGFVGLARGVNGEESFLDGLLKQIGGSRTVVFKVDGAKSGTLILGDPLPKECAADWEAFLSTPKAKLQMTIEADEVSAGKYQSAQKTALAFNDNFISLDPQNYVRVATELGVNMVGRLSCDQKQNVTVKAGGLEFTFGPEDYLAHRFVGCIFEIQRGRDNVIEIPLRYLSGKCVRYDFELETISVAKQS